MPSPTKPLTNGGRSSLSPEMAGALREGRTPPPAPSAVYAKRAREIIESEVSPPAPLIPDPGDADAKGNSSSFRRARAGTLPSSFQDSRTVDDEPALTPTASATPVRTSALSPAYPAASPARPALRHTTSSSANLDAPASSRMRSGSLTMPEGGLGNGSSPFGNGWLSTPGVNSGPSRSPLGHPEDLKYPRSDSTGSLTTDDISTLGYLGLADAGDEAQPASMSEMRRQAQRAIAQSGPASRNRASTVSNFARPYRPSVTSSAPYSREQSPYQSAVPDDELTQAIEGLGVYDNAYANNGHFYATAGIFNRDPNRPRSTTVGASLDNTMRRGHSNRSIGGYLASIPQSPATGHIEASMGFGYSNPRSYSERDLTRSRESSSSRGPRHSISSHSSRTGTPDFDKVSATPQMPTRSLWIGNLDVNATNDALLQVFAPYGAIESVRLLPEKTCAFVNFMDRTDAVRARDDVLNRLGGQVAALSETAPVRIGFGKIDSAPNGPITSTVAPAPPGLVFTNGSIGGVAVPPPVSEPIGPRSPEHNADLSTSPTRALWIGNIPGTTSSATLLQIFSPFGPVESARVLAAKCCGFINFERLDSAVSARTALNGREILGSDIGPIKIGFARVQTKSPVLGGPENGIGSPPIGQVLSGLTNVEGAKAVSTEQQLSAEGGGLENYRSPLVLEMVKNGVHEQVLEKGLANGGVVSEQQMIMQVLSAGRRDEDPDVKAAAAYRPPVSYYTTIGGVIGYGRRSDVAKLKDLRRRLDSGQCTLEEIDDITRDVMDESAELASDYIGNTVIQKLFERCSPHLRVEMLHRVAPSLAAIGVHKNGTWAAQKIIECSITEDERYLVTSHLRAYAPPLMCDSLGNYVCAGTLRFGSPYSDYVFDAMIDKMWDIAQNRFGARCMRTCLESPHTSLYQKKRISTGIILNSIPLATNPNGALLLTWLVDQSNLPGRYGLLANRFTPHIAHLCTHKLASLTVLRIITQTSEPAASTALINAIFKAPHDETLSDILSDSNNGAQVIGKLMAISTLSSAEKTMMTDAARRVLPNIKAASTPPYRSLLEAVGLPVPAGPVRASPVGHRNQWNPSQPNGPAQRGTQPPFQYGGFSQQQQQPHPYYHHQGILGQQQGMNLSPLLVPQNMPLGQMRGGADMGSPDPNLTPTPGKDGRTPVPHPRARLPFNSHVMSPTSDPFNPFASPSIDSPYMAQHPGHQPLRLSSQLGQQITTFQQQPNLGGLGIMGDQGPAGSPPGPGAGAGGPYYQQSLISSMYSATGRQY